MALAPDGSALLFDQAIEASPEKVEASPSNAEIIQTNQGGAVTTSNLWILPLDSDNQQPYSIGSGLNPQWLP